MSAHPPMSAPRADTSFGKPDPGQHCGLWPDVDDEMAYHAREHGFATGSRFVLVQGTATHDAHPDPALLAETVVPASTRFMGEPRTGIFWDRWLSGRSCSRRATCSITSQASTTRINLRTRAGAAVFAVEQGLVPADSNNQ